MSKKSYETDYEFILRLNEENIICQRYFNVKKFNPKTLKSAELTECVEDIVDEIINGLKLATYIDHMEENVNGYYFKPTINTSDNPDYFVFEFKYRGEQKVGKWFDATIYPTTVRHQVDIREQIPYFIEQLTMTLSRQNNQLTLMA